MRERRDRRIERQRTDELAKLLDDFRQQDRLRGSLR
jgi:hypothetical protein